MLIGSINDKMCKINYGNTNIFHVAQYDRGGPQHRITWGRGSPHTSAVFGDTEKNVTAVVGHKARLPCQVKNLGRKSVRNFF